jgi:hypothetical protein
LVGRQHRESAANKKDPLNTSSLSPLSKKFLWYMTDSTTATLEQVVEKLTLTTDKISTALTDLLTKKSDNIKPHNIASTMAKPRTELVQNKWTIVSILSPIILFVEMALGALRKC